jgi:hypothetical protein
MVAWMTSTENRALENADRQGFLHCKREQRTLIDEHASHCAQLGQPCLRLEVHSQQCQVTLHWHSDMPALTAEQQLELRAILQPSDTHPGLLPIVFRYGAYSAFLTHQDAERLAHRLAAWLQDQSFRA